MLYLKLIFRNFWKNAGFSAINIVGLSVSLAVCALIGLYLHFEYSFDRHNPAHASIYRLNTTFKYPNSPENTHALSSAMMGPYLTRSCKDIERYLRVMPSSEDMLCRAGNRELSLGQVLEVDSTFFSFFDYQLLYGDPTTAFSQPGNVVLTRAASEALFGTEMPLGKVVENTFTQASGADTTLLFTVSGVMADLPKNTHLRFDALLPLDARQFERWDEGSRWHGVVANTYVQLHPSAKSGAALEPELALALQKEMPNSDMIALTMQPLTDIHLGSTHLQDKLNHQPSNRKYAGVLGMVALFILFISSINFANLSTVMALKRGQEVGVRKSLGASGRDIMRNFLSESLLMALLAGGLGLLWAVWLKKPFLTLMGRDFDLQFPAVVLLGFAGLVLALGFLSGIYPAFQAARQSVVKVFELNRSAVSVKRPFVQRLVVLQFVLSGTLIIGSLICYQQLSFMKNKDLGFHYDQVLEMNLGNGNWMHATALKSELSVLPGVRAVSSSDYTLGSIEGQNGLMVRNPETRKWENQPMSIVRVEHDYFDLYDMKFIAGRAPSPEAAANGLEYVVNEAFVKKMGWKGDLIGQEIMRATWTETPPGRVVGVIRDVHHNSLHNAIAPICMQGSMPSSLISMKVEPASLSAVLAQARDIWSRHVKDRPFDYTFMDEHFAQLYDSENRLAQALFFATLLSVFIACLGLLALSSFVVSQRTKEIGIRKVLGASVAGITGLLAIDFLKLVIIALVIASPVAYYFMDKWLSDFAYRIDMEWWMFAVAGALAVAIAFLTVGFQSVRAALANPVKSLRSE
jgi:putative ABC transport system permease protein